jgi:sterol desaturase/sphingolipid hydroxylase (fatty acid hydroxylase superfamily)
MTFIDSVVLNLIERSCRGFQRLTGRTNVWLALQLTNLSIIVYFVWAGLYAFNIDIELRVVAAVFCVALLYVLTQTIFKTPIETYETAAYQRVAKGLRNPRRIRDALLRTSFLTLCLVLAYPVLFVYQNLRTLPLQLKPNTTDLVVLSYLLILLTTSVLYLLACDPLPPCMGKVREWMRGLSSSRVGLPESE